MPLSPCFLQRIGAVTLNGVFKVAMSSSSSNARGKNNWVRGFCDRPLGGFGGLTGVDALASGYSHVSDLRGASYGFGQVYNGASCQSWGGQQQPLWYWRPSQPGLPPRSADHRNWIHAASQPPWGCERFKVLSYNILADYLALDHHCSLYFHIPDYMLAWEWRKRRLLVEFGLWSADIMCLQEVDRFCDLKEELAIRGYAGIWKMRTGNAADGCAIFWRTNRFQLRYEEDIEFKNLGLRDNVAQICVLETVMRKDAENTSAALPTSYRQSGGANQIIVCNTHVLYNPKRGEIKLGQVRVLLDRAYAISECWNNAPVIVCGDFNSTPMSPLYNFIAMQKLNLSGLAKNQISGQYSAALRVGPDYGLSSYSRNESQSAFGTQQDYYKSRPENQHNMGSPLFENPTVVKHPDVQPKVDRQMSFDAMAIKLGEAKIYGHQGGEVSSTRWELSNMPSRTSKISSQQSIIHVHREADNSRGADKNIEPQKNTLDEPCFEGHNVSSGRGDLAGAIKLSSTSCIDCSTASSLSHKINFHGFQKDNNYVGNSPSFHSSIDDFSSTTSCEGLSSEGIDVGNILHVDVADEPSTSCASLEITMRDNIENSSTGSAVTENACHLITCLSSGKDKAMNLYEFDGSHVSDRMAVAPSIEDTKAMEIMNFGGDRKEVSSDKILQEVPIHNGNLGGDVTSAENRTSPDLSCSVKNEDHQSFELCSLEKNADQNFLKELLGTEDEIQTMKDFNSSSMEPLENSSFPLSSDASNEEWYLYNPYYWSSMDLEIASGRENCTVVEHPLKLRSVYRDVEDYTGTKDSSREPQVTSYNLQFMGTVDYIWCSEELLTATVLDTIPKHVMRSTTRGFPTRKWGSDHIALVCELAFSPKIQ